VMKRLTVLALANALVLIVLTSVAANAQFTVTESAAVNAIVGSPFAIVPPGATAPVPLGSSHDAEIENTGTTTLTGTIQISLRLFADPGGGSTTTYDLKFPPSEPGPWAPGDRYFVNGVFPAGHNGGVLTTTFSQTKDLGLGMYTARAFTHIMIGLVSHNVDDGTKKFVVH
jgi:hypothetical protein